MAGRPPFSATIVKFCINDVYTIACDIQTIVTCRSKQEFACIPMAKSVWYHGHTSQGDWGAAAHPDSGKTIICRAKVKFLRQKPAIKNENI